MKRIVFKSLSLVCRSEVILSIPIHFRYSSPGNASFNLTIPPPNVFNKCLGDEDWVRLSVESNLVEATVPVGLLNDRGFVEVGTFACTISAMLLLLYKITFKKSTKNKSN